MSPREHHMNVRILSPSGTVTVGSDRKLVVTVRASVVVKKQPVDPGDPGGGGGGGGPVRPKGGGRNRPEKDIQPLDDRRMEVDAVEVKLGANGTYKKAASSHSSKFKWRLTDKAPSTGKLEIKARAKSKILPASGGRDKKTVTVKEDNTPPDLKIVSPESDDKIKGEGPNFDVDVEGTASHKEGIKSVKIGVDKATKRISRSSGSWRDRLELRGTGDHRIVVRAVNKIGNEQTKSITVTTVDTGKPDLKITSPSRGERVFNWPGNEDLTVHVEGEAEDDGTGIESVKWRLGDEEGTVRNGSGDPGEKVEWSAEIPIPEPGDHTIEFVCLDKAKKPNETTERITVRADDTPPEVTNINPSSPHTIPPEEGVVTVEVRGEIEDAVAKVSSVEWSLNDGEYEPAKPLEDDWSEWGFPVDIEEAGLHTVRVRTAHASGTLSQPKILEIEREEGV